MKKGKKPLFIRVLIKLMSLPNNIFKNLNFGIFIHLISCEKWLKFTSYRGRAMKKTACSVLVLLSILILCSCSNRTNSSVRDEMEVINENLRLKDKVAELEKEIEEKNERSQSELEIQKLVSEFFYSINIGDIDEARKKITERIKLTSNVLSLPNNRDIKINRKEYLRLYLEKAKWNYSDQVCLTFDQYTDERNQKINVYVVKQKDDWKIDNMSFNYGV